MEFAFVVFLSVSTVLVVAIPPPTPREKAIQLLTGKFPVDPTTPRFVQKRVGFKYYYVHPGTFSKTASSNAIRVEATMGVSETAHYEAALIISKMTRRMSSTIFNQLARNVKVGVFTKSEGLTVFPEYASLRDRPGCYNGNCDGSCAQTCTFDHRKYSSIAGTGGQLTAIVQDNILCNGQDPYHGQSNQLVHEFAHTVMRHGVSSATRSQIKAAYNHAVSARLWTPGVYAMQNEEEYWAEGTQVFFNVEHLSYTTGGMNTCNSGSYCSSEQASRHWLGTHDLTLYNILQLVWENNQGFQPSGIKVCQR